VAAMTPAAEATKSLYWALCALQHRGQDSAGIAVSDGRRIRLVRRLGLVAQSLREPELERLRGAFGIGHVRYTTVGTPSVAGAQPIVVRTADAPLALAHNGQLTVDAADGASRAGSDTHALARLLASPVRIGTRLRLEWMLPQVSGAYSLVLVDDEAVYAVRDPHGFRPLCIGSLGRRGWMVASESCALDAVGATYVRDVEPGEIVSLMPGRLRSSFYARADRAACVFELVYFSRADSRHAGGTVFDVRYRLGEALARLAPVAADMVVPVPDSGIPAALGYSFESGLSYRNALIRNNYVGRTFILPDDRSRAEAVRIKFTPLAGIVRGRRVVLVDDSIVRAHTLVHVVSMLRDAGARAVHVRIASPPVRWPCVYGIDMPTRRELVAARLEPEGVRRRLAADSLEYLGLDALIGAASTGGEGLCAACFSGRYPDRACAAACGGPLVAPARARDRRKTRVAAGATR